MEHAPLCVLYVSTCFVTVGQGSVLKLTRVTRAHMGPYLCIASNGVPPAVSKRIVLNVYCTYLEYVCICIFSGGALVCREQRIYIYINKL